MPANLPPQYLEAEKKLRTAKTPQEKIQVIEAMLSIIPHHKGTDKLIGQLRKKLSRLREEAEARTGSRRIGNIFYVKKEGAAQVAIVGLPNSGKSSLLNSLTNAESKIADYPHTTQLPVPGMLSFNDIQIQMVDLPPIMDAAGESWLYDILRNADLLMLVIDLTGEPAAQLELIIEDLKNNRICLKATSTENTASIGDTIKKAIVVGNKLDLPGAAEGSQEIRLQYGSALTIHEVSARQGTNLKGLGAELFKSLALVRVYTRVPGKKPDMDKPFALPKGSTVKDLAGQVHHDFERNLKFARIWSSDKYSGQKVSADYILEDGDIIELHE